MLKRLFLTFAAALFGLAAPAVAAEPVIAIVGADVLPMTRAARLADQTVLVSGDRILAVGPRAQVPIPAGARRIDARGMTLMPGLVDMHVHLSPQPGRPGDATQRALAVMLAHGVTTARGMAGAPLHPAVRAAIEKGEIAGPRFYAGAPSLHKGNTPSPNAARAAVAMAKSAGFDLVKSHHLDDLAIWQAVQEEAKLQGLPVAGHVTDEVGLERVMAAGQQVEHLDGVVRALLPKDSAEKLMPFGQIPPPPVIDAALRVGNSPLAALARTIAAAKSWHVPTLALFERIADSATPTERLRAAPEMRYIPDTSLTQWAAQREGGGLEAESGAKLIQLRRRIVRALHLAGVPIMAGSDTAQAFHIWGPGMIAEVQALGAAGLRPIDALRSATVVPRDYFRSLPNGGSALGWRAEFGTVERGARADLILLRGDPSRDLAQLRRLDTVIAAGRLYDRAALDKMLDGAAKAAKGP
jgi:imidazolonepropionase-like amidohydrolase